MITITQSAKDYLYSIAQKNDKDIVSFGVKGCLLYTSDAADE